MAHILIVDDERLVARSMAAQVRQLGHEPVAVAATGPEAIDAARQSRPDVALVDLALPELDGAEVTRELWHALGVPSLIVSGYADDTSIKAATAAGALGYLVKPVGAVDLQPAIDVAIVRARDLREAQAHADDLTRRLHERKVIERAKGLLMDRLNLTEDAAYRRLQRESRNQRRPLADLAASAIATE